MNATRLLSALLSFMMCGHALAQVQDIDKELSDLADRLAVQIKDQGKKKVAVKLGISNGAKAEVLAGLKEGQQVVLQ